ncbi:MAG: FAD-dependent oxidoreductase [Burkholderiaceae bacterium]|nr:FAD-dependent oxidoreductase [Burkholderiaceae bacterium]
MQSAYQYPKYQYRRPPELDRNRPVRHPVLIVGAGPVGMCAAIDLALHNVPAVVLDDEDSVSTGSRAVCYAKRAIEILDRLGCGDALARNGVSWNVGRTFLREQEVYSFDLQPETGHRRPGMVNLQQYHLEQYLVERIGELDLLDLRWKNRVVSVTPIESGALVEIETPDGRYTLAADWLIVADGARSPVRRQLGLDVEGQVFRDRFLIADVVMKADFPTERRFWFDPPFHRGQSVLLHKQADNVWRIDFQLGWDADPDEEKKPERVIPRIRAMLGEDREFELEWVSVYTFQCRRMKSFRHGRMLFAGDAAHQISPFGARGANSGIQDADNLAWKLAMVLAGDAPERLLDSYAEEREFAADENIANSTRSTDFITPKSATSLAFRDATLTLAADHAFARVLVNSGRLSVPSFYLGSQLNSEDREAFAGRMMPGAPCDDAPVTIDGESRWLLEVLGGRFQALLFVDDPQALPQGAREFIDALVEDSPSVQTVVIARVAGHVEGARVLVDAQGLAARRYDAREGTVHLLRPDQHVCARMREPDIARARDAVRRALCID